MKRKHGKLLALILALVMCISIFPMAVFAEEAAAPITVYVTIANKDKIAVGTDSAKTLIAQVPVTVSDTDSNGHISVDEALAQTHALYYAGGYAYGDAGGYNAITKLCGVESTATGFYVNNVYALTGAAEYYLSENDYLNAYLYTDTNTWSDLYTYFDVYSAVITPNTNLDVTLNKVGFDESYNAVSSPIVGAEICTVNATTGVLTTMGITSNVASAYTAAGSCTLNFQNEGTYYVSAKASELTLVPSILKVTVKNGADTVINYADDTTFSLNTSKPKDTFANIYKNAGSYMYGMIEKTPALGVEDFLMPLARAGFDFSENYINEYVADLVKNKEDTSGSPSIIFALTSVKKDASNVNGKNYLKAFKNLTDITGMYTTNEAYSLIALDTANYWPEIKALGGTSNSKDIVADLLSKQVTNGGWGYDGTNVDLDTTGMVMQALAPYYATNKDVKAAVDKALTILSATQQANGSYLNWGSENSATAAEVAIALCSLGINPATDSRFVKPEGSLMDAILRSYISEKGFAIQPQGAEENEYATYECYTALVAYDRLVKGQNTLFDMSDVDFAGLSSNTDKGTVTADSKLPDVQISAARGVIPNGTVLSVKSATIDSSKIKITSGNEVLTILNIELLKDETEIQPNGTIKVKIAIPEEYKNKKNLGISWVKDDGSVEDMKATIEGNYLVFSTTHLSNYAITASKEVIANTADNTCVVASVAFTLSSAIGAAFVLASKKKMKNN